MGRNTRLDFNCRLKIYEFLKHDDVLKPQSTEPPTCSYVEPWHDRAVADHMTKVLGVTITENNVQGVRLNTFGTLIDNKVRLPGLDNIEAINELKRRLDSSELRQFDMQKQINDQDAAIKRLEHDMASVKLATKFKVTG